MLSGAYRDCPPAQSGTPDTSLSRSPAGGRLCRMSWSLPIVSTMQKTKNMQKIKTQYAKEYAKNMQRICKEYAKKISKKVCNKFANMQQTCCCVPRLSQAGDHDLSGFCQ